ncbi:MAG: hypothetical protein ACE5H4_03425 [Candidatus Thorarchaeota archaeon]
MQTLSDVTVTSVLVTIGLSVLMAAYLIRMWFHQEHRLNTDLPLMFGIVFMAQAVNNLIRLLPMVGILEMTLELFRVRALVIIATSFPLLGVVLHIWLPGIRRHHMKILGALVAYWVTAALLGPTEETIILLVMPVILTLTIGMVLTFAVTWKTGRLKEVRSDLMVVSFIFGILSQVVATDILLNNVLTAVATVVATLGLTNPWRSRKTREMTTRPAIVPRSRLA